MYITWKYDLFPYLLCGKVKKSKGNGIYTVVGYDGMAFKANTVIKNDTNGMKVKKKIEALAEQRRAIVETLELGWEQELISFINNTI